MKVYFRVDASVEIGTGHVMRCLTLADELTRQGGRVSFICRDLMGNIYDVILKKGYEVYRLTSTEMMSKTGIKDNQQLGVNWEIDAAQTKAILERGKGDIEWLIIDHYGVDRQWESEMRPFTKKIMVIDDLADRSHDCDLLLDQNLTENMKIRYEKLVPVYCQKLIGPQFALLRSEFVRGRKKLKERDGVIRRIMVFFGGSDPTNETLKVLKAISLFNRQDIAVDVVVGTANPHRKTVKELAAKIPNVTLYFQVENMAELMLNVDLAIGAGGTTTWERCCLGLPSLVTILSKNQYELTLSVEKFGAIINMGCGYDVTPEHYLKVINNLSSRDLIRMSLNGLKLVDGEGCARVAQEVFSPSKY